MRRPVKRNFVSYEGLDTESITHRPRTDGLLPVFVYGFIFCENLFMLRFFSFCASV